MSGLAGAKGKKQPTQRAPVESPNTLRSTSKGRILDLIVHGPIVGLADGMKSVFLDDTALQNADGTFNFDGVTVTTREGYPDQEHIAGFRAVENPHSVATEVKFASPVIRAVTNNDADAVVVTLQVNSLGRQDPKTGDSLGHNVAVGVDVRLNGGAWQTRISDVISGKTTSAYQRSYRVELPSNGSWEVRVRRQSPDETTSYAQSATHWATMTEVVDARLSYPDSALVALEIDAQLFGNQMPARSYDMKLSIIQVPSNYDPETRVYTGIWNGTFKMAWSDNPAWVYYDLATHPAIGAGLGGVDKWYLYQIARYCDVLVPDGYGAMEPRFTVNTLFAERTEAITTLSTLASVFRGMTYWGTDTVVAVADMPTDPRKLVSPANVVNGEFEYSGTALKERHSVAIVMWNDPEDGHKSKPELVEDPESVELFGWREVQVTAFGCTSRGQANRLGKWILYSERMETQTVSYAATADHADLRPGDIIELSDPDRAGARLSGRVTVSGLSTLTLDKVPAEVAGFTWYLGVHLPNGLIERRQVSSFAGNEVNTLTPLSAAPVVGAMWLLSSASVTPPQYRVVSVDEEDDGSTYSVLATEYDPRKYEIVELGLTLPEPPNSLIPTGPLAPALDISTRVYTYLAGGTEHQGLTVSWTPSPDPRTTHYIAEVQGPADVIWRTAHTGDAVSFDEKDAAAGQWMIRVRAMMGYNLGSAWATRTTNIAGLLMPVAPDSVNVQVGTFEITLRPRGVYPGAMYEFWRSGVVLAPELIESNAVLLSVSTDLIDAGLTPDTDYYYYIRGANAYGVSTWYPVQATTNNDPGVILNILSGQIRETHLYQDLTTKIGLIEATAAAVQTETSARTTADMSLGTRIDTVFSSIGANTAAIQTETAARSTADTALSSQINTVQTTVDGYSASIQAQAVSINGLSAQYTLRLDVNGYISGFGLSNGGGGTSAFAVLADKFYISSPGSVDVMPFIVSGGNTYIRSTVIQDASITTAKIDDAAITNAKISGIIQSDVIGANGRPLWKLDKSGIFELNSLGAGGRMEQRADVIKVFDSNGVLRVQLGNLSA